MADSQALLGARFGIDIPGTEVPDAIAPLIDRRVTRRYTEQDVPDSLLDALLAAAQSAPAKSDLQQFSVVVMRDRARIKQIADWIGTMDWIATAPVFLVWCGDMRRGQRLCALHDMPHANNNMDTFLNTAVDCALAMGAFMAFLDMSLGVTGPSAGAIANAAGVNSVYLAGAVAVALSTIVAMALIINPPLRLER